MTANRWTDEAKRRFVQESKRGDSYRTLARRYGLGVETAKSYDSKFSGEVGGARALPSAGVRTPLEGFRSDALRSYREGAEMSPGELAKLAGLPVWMLHKMERGELSPYTDTSGHAGPSPVERLVSALDITISDLQREPSAEQSEDRLRAVERKIDRVLEKLEGRQ